MNDIIISPKANPVSGATLSATGMPRIMWLLNHSSARRFEIPMLRACGFDEIFLPKIHPVDPSFRSASVDFSEDKNLTIPPADLAVLNAADWYGDPGRDAWAVANRHFSLLFFIVHTAEALGSISDHFQGAAIWRAYGLERTNSYSNIRKHFTNGVKTVEKMGDRFWFGEAYEDLREVEGELIQRRAVYLPLGLPATDVINGWTGRDRRVFFVCPDIGFNPYYRGIFEEFSRDFAGLPYAVGGSQPITVADPNVLGFVSKEEHERNMREMRVMYYHSREPRHIHYHPFEAVRAGMPLVFMAGGMLDKLGGVGLPGRARTGDEARSKIQRLLQGDDRLIEEIRTSQHVLLDPMRPEKLEDTWRRNLTHVVERLQVSSASQIAVRTRKKRIAIILPIVYRGGTLRAAKLLAEAVSRGSEQAGESAEVVLLHLDQPSAYSAKDWSDLPPSVTTRTFNWWVLDKAEAKTAMMFDGHSDWNPVYEKYLVVDDGIMQLGDCDLWVVISDRLSLPILPMRPVMLTVFDYLQRHYRVSDLDEQILLANRLAKHVLVTTEFTRQDALQYAGIDPRRVTKVPMLVPGRGQATRQRNEGDEGTHFIWTTNLAAHKNHRRALAALQLYYETYQGKLSCHVTGFGSSEILKSQLPHLEGLNRVVAGSRALRQKVRFLGELSDEAYRRELAAAAFLWHPTELDNGTFSVIEAAHYGVPSLSSDYPAMREMDGQFQLGLSFMDQEDPEDMAAQLHEMELNLAERRHSLATEKHLEEQGVEHLASSYWRVVRELI
ncbi:glycosyltransferase [Mesorhizobium sp. LSJC264A00]|uniref:glycosyltransferase n=1 Tax=Mesorhizobium sp. LSJC264A00 TaxID=1287321 RepID=UPI001FD88599|nr:glycosyltransferase [Mesorhizobium sp. LSJC264A00]